jgi:hypothetical protein
MNKKKFLCENKKQNKNTSYQINSAPVDGIIDPVPPPLQLDNVEFELLRLSIDIAKGGAAGTSGPVLAGDLAVELGEVGLFNGFVEVLQTFLTLGNLLHKRSKSYRAMICWCM